MPARSIRKFPVFKSWNRLSFVSQSRPRSRTLSSVIGESSSRNSFSQGDTLNEGSASDSQAKPHLDASAFTKQLLYQWMIPEYGHIKLTDYAPLAFKSVRERFDIGLLELEDALGEGICHISKSAGKSNSIFFATPDNRFLFKTLRGSEEENLVHFLPKYLNHIQSQNETLLPQYLGLFTFEPPPQAPASPLLYPAIHPEISSRSSEEASVALLIETTLSKPFTFVLMANVMHPRIPIHLRFDFKGSNVGRAALSAQDVARASPQALRGVVLKELDWEQLRRREGPARFEGVRLCVEERTRVMEVLRRDVEMLKGFGFMDYSLLVGVHRCGEGCEEVDGAHMAGVRGLGSGVNEVQRGEVYFLGLIDVLQKFNLAKWIERELHRHRSRTSLFLGGGSGSPTTQPDVLVRRAISEQSLTLAPRESGCVVNKTRSIPVLVPNPEIPYLAARKNSMSSISSGTETSVEEPGRYAERLMNFAATLLL
ncbi:hypothetical protein BC830DRAFT_1117452 [Chytriomyces sp. MP71]|nr:hypothetical protein BC830DRAFT_1117452 [Chytriomyces sp. MP71]